MQDGPRGDWSTDMQRYRFTQDYRSGIGAWREGDRYDFDPEMAAFIERDSPGTIELVPGTLVFVPEEDGDESSKTEDEESEDEESEDEESEDEESEDEESEDEESEDEESEDEESEDEESEDEESEDGESEDEESEDEESEDDEPEDDESEDEATRAGDGPPHDRQVTSARKRGS